MNSPETPETDIGGTVAAGSGEEPDDGSGFPIAAVIIGCVVLVGVAALLVITRMKKGR